MDSNINNGKVELSIITTFYKSSNLITIELLAASIRKLLISPEKALTNMMKGHLYFN